MSIIGPFVNFCQFFCLSVKMNNDMSFFNEMAIVFSIKKLLASKHTTLRSAIVSSTTFGSGQHLVPLLCSPPQALLIMDTSCVLIWIISKSHQTKSIISSNGTQIPISNQYQTKICPRSKLELQNPFSNPICNKIDGGNQEAGLLENTIKLTKPQNQEVGLILFFFFFGANLALLLIDGGLVQYVEQQQY